MHQAKAVTKLTGLASALALVMLLSQIASAQSSPSPSPRTSPSPAVSASPSPRPSSAPSNSPSPTAGNQKNSSTESVFAPFVNRLRIAVKDPQIRLTWEDIPNFTGTYLIYRNNVEITAENLAKSTKVAEIKQGDQYYTDVPPAAGVYFYAIIAREASGTSYSIFIPLRNKSISPTAIASNATQNDLATSVSALSAVPGEGSIVVTMQSTRNNRTVALFRSTSPIAKISDLQNATQIQTSIGRSLSITDFAVPGVPYYYAAADLEAYQSGVWPANPGANTLKSPVEIALGTKADAIPGLTESRRTRALPLPILTLPDISPSSLVLADTNPVTVSAKLDPEVRKLVDKLAAPVAKDTTEIKKAQLLPSDRLAVDGKLSQPSAGDTKPLYEILTNDFVKSNWDESIRLLDNFLSVPHNTEVSAKARFYLGQSLYLIGKYKEALLEFLLVRDELEDYAQTWVDNTLALSNKW